MAQQTDWMNFDLNAYGRDLGDMGSGSADSISSGFADLNLPSGDLSKNASGGIWDSIKGLGKAWGNAPGNTTIDNKTGVTTLGKYSQAFSTFTGLANSYLGWQQFNLAKDQMAQNKKIFNLNFANQAQLTNTQMEDRQRARNAAGEGMNAEAYMNKNAIKAKGI